MRRPAYRASETTTMGVNMTPMIDVVFQLLIFFVCTTSFQALEELLPTGLQAPGVTGRIARRPAEIEDLEEVIIKVGWQDGAPRWEINDHQCRRHDELRSLLAEVASIGRELPVILDVDGQVPLGTMIDSFDLCRLAGFRDIRFAANAP
jgi:biopolymer transport protein ExbD